MTEGSTGRLVARIADAYAIPPDAVADALSSHRIDAINPAMVSLERHGDQVLVVESGEPLAALELGGVLPPIAAACDTLDPYGDRTYFLVATSVHDPLQPRVVPGAFRESPF